jgi:diaminopropionate ammonia-lyase
VHRRLPGYAPSPLVRCPRIAAELGVGEVRVKDESNRLGLPSFKILGASYAVCRLLGETFGGALGDIAVWSDVGELRALVAPVRPLTLVAATDGNHGRAVARMAALLGLDAKIYVPEGTVAARVVAIEGEGAAVEVVAGDYDAAVRRSAADAGPRHLVVSDTSWEGYRTVPGWVIDGYTTIFDEITEFSPTHVVVPIGVGALATAAVRYCGEATAPVPALLGVEPATAACVQASLRAGAIVEVPGPHRSIMAGLNCGTPSRIAWPTLLRGLDAVVAIEDEAAREAMRVLAKEGVVSGETGAAALAGLCAVRHTWARLGPASRVLVLSTEGATDPDAYREIVRST